MKKQTLIATASLIALLAFGAITASAQTAATSSAKGTNVAQAQADRMAARKTKADAEIDRRVTTLNGLLTRINNIKKLPATDKSTLSSQIQSEISSLTALKTKIDGDTDAATLNVDIQSIISGFRVYLLFMPKTNLYIGSDLVLQINDIFATVQTQIQTKIQAAQAAGQDVTALQAALTDMQAKVTDATNQANSAVSLVTPLVPDKTTNYTPTLKSARADLQTARKDLQAARQDIQTIIQGLKGAKASTSSSSATAK